jgi:signal transduction histidine kinase
MITSLVFRLTTMTRADTFAWWGRLRLVYKFAVVACMLVLAGMVYVGLYVTEHIRENTIHRAAAEVALYMDSVVERHVQELATRSSLSEANLQALERLLSPASMHRPVVAFRVWKGDTIIFGNERQLVGRTFPLSATRKRATQGQLGVEFDHPDGDDDEQIWALNLPILEVYAPVRERGTGRIIALVETYEVAVELKNEIWASQLAAWIIILAIAAIDVFFMLSIARSGSVERETFKQRIAELSRLRAESERHRQRISHASLQVSAMNERSLRSVGDELRDETAQHIALALLKFESLHELVSSIEGEDSPAAENREEDLEVIRSALNQSLRHIRGVAGDMLPADIEELSVIETLARAARRHERRTGRAVTVENRGLPEQLPFPIKACLYRFALESLESTSSAAGASCREQSILASSDNRTIVLEVAGRHAEAEAASRPLTVRAPQFGSLRDRVEAIGGRLNLVTLPAGGVSLIAELSFSDLELARG